jgi:benzoyl-CoA reductase/2-hydroxyglutaryl-CoA dehydratase subunit BcrC/BadD/HgdB
LTICLYNRASSTDAKERRMTRREYLLQQKEKGRRLIGVLPAHYPKEILWAFDAVPAEIWDPPLEISGANAHFQTYICSVVKLGMELILQGKADLLDGFLFPHTCDSMQNMASIVHDYMRVDKPCYFFYHPKAPYRPSSRAYYLEQLKALVSALEKDFGAMDEARLTHGVEQGRRLSSLLRNIYEARRRGALSASNAAFYRAIRQGEYLHPDDLIPLMENLRAETKDPSPKGPAVIMSGVLPNPPEILDLLDELGVRIADDDLMSCGRRVPMRDAALADPFDALVETYFAMPPCTTKNASFKERMDWLLTKMAASGAKGVIFYLTKFCETEWFDVPLMTGAVKEAGASVLVVDVDLNQDLSGQLTTRVEAFAEMISQ